MENEEWYGNDQPYFPICRRYMEKGVSGVMASQAGAAIGLAPGLRWEMGSGKQLEDDDTI